MTTVAIFSTCVLVLGTTILLAWGWLTPSKTMTSAETHRPSAEPRPPWLPERLYPFESHYADVDGARVHYVDEGNGPPLLLLHGNPTWSFLYRDVIKGL